MASRIKEVISALSFFVANHVVMKYLPYSFRHSFLRRVLGLKIGVDSTFCFGVFVSGSKIQVGNNTVVNRNVYLDGRGGLVIGNNVNISHFALIQTLTHDHNSPAFQAHSRPVVIGDDVWIGARALILPGVELGRGAVVGAGAVVTRNVEPYQVVAGSPARVVGRRNADLNYLTKYRPMFDSDIQ